MAPADSTTDPVFSLDRRALARSFDRASASYDAAAVLQSQVRAQLLERLQFLRQTPARVLDLGCGTGAMTLQLAREYPLASVVAIDLAPAMAATTARALRNRFTAPRFRQAARHLLGNAQHRLPRRAQQLLSAPPQALCADASQLPLRSGSINVVFSSLMLQWCENLDVVLAQVHRVLTPGGLFLFSTFGPDSLRELRSAWSAADGFNHVNHFVDMHDLGGALSRAGFAEPVLDVDRIDRPCGEVAELMRELKLIGAHNVTAGRARGLTGKRRFAAMQAAYEQQRRGGVLPVTYEVIYGCAWAPPEIAINIGQIRRRSR